MKIRIKKIDPDVKTPSYAHAGDAGIDLYARETVTLKPGEKCAVPTGIRIEIPDGYVGLIWDKSGLAIKNGLKTLGGVFDSGYRGEWLIGMVNLSSEPYTFEKNHKIAQLLIQKIEQADIEIVPDGEELSDTSRGTGGFGSTGK